MTTCAAAAATAPAPAAGQVKANTACNPCVIKSKDGTFDGDAMTHGACVRDQQADCPATGCRHRLAGGTKVFLLLG